MFVAKVYWNIHETVNFVRFIFLGFQFPIAEYAVIINGVVVMELTSRKQLLEKSIVNFVFRPPPPPPPPHTHTPSGTVSSFALTSSRCCNIYVHSVDFIGCFLFFLSKNKKAKRESSNARKTSHKQQTPTVTLTWHTSKYKVHKFNQRCILEDEST